MNILAMQAEVNEWAALKGWEPDPNRTFADECALMHSEVSEALEAYRTWKFEDATKEPVSNSGLPKPEGVGSEQFHDLTFNTPAHHEKIWVVDLNCLFAEHSPVLATIVQLCQ